MSRLDVSIIVISFNTRELTLECLRSVYAETRDVTFEVIVIDNDSDDQSAEAIAREFPQLQLDALDENLGFGGACNYATSKCEGEYILMLNPDTVVLDGAIQELVGFARQHPEVQLFGGRTLWGDHTLNPTSCWRRPTLWSVFCRAVGLTAAFPANPLFDTEAYGSWKRDCIRQIDIVTGCLMLIHRNLWEEMGGFDKAFFQRGEDTDFCLRARTAGHTALHCPDSTIVHLGGQSERILADKVVRNLHGKQAVFDRQWSAFAATLGMHLQRVWVLTRWAGYKLTALLGKEASADKALIFREVWDRRDEWRRLAGVL